MTSSQEEFWEACRLGNVSKLREVIEKGEEIDMNAGNPKDSGKTGLFAACERGLSEIVRYLLALPQIDVNKADRIEQTPLFVSCWKCEEDLVEILLRDERVEVNRPDKDGETPLWIACYWGNDKIIKMFFACGRTIDVHRRGRFWNNIEYSPAEIAKKEQGAKGERIADLIAEYERNPKELLFRVRKELVWTTRPGEIFALGAFLCDGFFTLINDEENSSIGTSGKSLGTSPGVSTGTKSRINAE